MVRYLVSKKGVPVLASARSDPAAQSACLLFIKYNEEPLQLSFYLQCTTSIHGYDDEQTFTLIYDADKLMHDATSLNDTTTCLSHDQLTSIARAGNPQIRALALTLAKPCQIRCPPSTGILAAKSGSEAPFHRLVNLAKATMIDVLFDYNWVHADNRPTLARFFEQSGRFAGFPESTVGHRYADWAVFRTVEEVREPPPSYTNAVDVGIPQKRSRRITNPSHSASPPRKRPQYDPGSPTEVATSPPCPPGTSYSTPSEKETASLSHIHTSLQATAALAFQEAVNRAVEAQLPGIVQNILPGIVKSMLPDILHSSLAPRRSQSASPPISPRCPQSSTSLDVLVADRLKDLAKDHLTSIFDNANDHAYSLRNQADAEFEDAVADHKIDVDTIKEDCIHELGEVANDKLCKFKDQAREIVESAVEELESKTCGIRDDICEGLEDFVKAASSSLQKVRASNTARAQTASTT